MRKYFIFTSFVLLFCCMPVFVHAQDYVNNMGVTIPDEDYNNLKKLYTEEHISILSQEKYDQIMSMNLEFDNVQTKIQYIKTEINQVTGKATHTQITKMEYDNATSNANTRATLIGTSYKQVVLGFAKTSEINQNAFFTLNALWKIMPVVRSFDVIGVRLSNLTVVNGTQQGQQIYKINGETDFVQYNFNGTNIKNLDNGFGISMNLLNADVEYLECTIDASMGIDEYPAGLFGSYQHAIENVTLATSQSYSIGGTGLGGVFVFPSNIRLKYDTMEGVYDYFSS